MTRQGVVAVPLIDNTTTWYRLAAWCSNPACRRRPRLRVSPRLMSMAHEQEPDAILLDYQCHGRDCGAVYPLPASAFHHAEPDETRRAA